MVLVCGCVDVRLVSLVIRLYAATVTENLISVYLILNSCCWVTLDKQSERRLIWCVVMDTETS